MKITFFSDIHEEFGTLDTDLVHPGDILVIAGDLCPFHLGLAELTLLELSAKFEHIIYVAGNHEYYGWDIKHASPPFLPRENVHFLHNQSITIRDKLFLGCTLWTDFGK